MSVIVAGFVAVFGVAAGLALLLGLLNRYRWGTVAAGTAVPMGDGAFRSAPMETRESRGVPVRVYAAGISGFVWAAATAFVFVPAGALLGVALLDSETILAIGTLAIVGDGVLVVIALVTAGVYLLIKHGSADRVSKGVAIWSAVHHLVVLLAFGIAFLAEVGLEEALIGLAMLSVPVIIGWTQAGALYVAGGVE